MPCFERSSMDLRCLEVFRSLEVDMGCFAGYRTVANVDRILAASSRSLLSRLSIPQKLTIWSLSGGIFVSSNSNGVVLQIGT